MHYHCIKAVEQKAYCLFIYLIGSNCASIYSAQGQAEAVVICSDSSAQPWFVLQCEGGLVRGKDQMLTSCCL